MLYEFKHEPTGEIIDIDFPMGDAPSIGEEILHGGRVVRRIASDTEFNTHPNTGKYPYESAALPSTIAKEGHCQLSAKGRPVIRSKKHENDIAARYGLVKGL